MREGYRALLGRVEVAFSDEGTPAPERRRRAYYVVSVGFLLAALVGIAISDILAGHDTDAAINLTFVTLMAASLIYLRFGGSFTWILRFGFGGGLLTLLYEMNAKVDDALVLQWLIVHPIAVFFLLGAREGALWVLGGAGLSTLVLLSLADHRAYDPAFLPVFMPTFLVLGAIGYSLEASRRRLMGHVEAETAALERALAQEATLQDLMPICAQCKSVRDDEGYWHKIETYLDEHTPAALESALCPACHGRDVDRG
ncbi:MAG: hypothetical protein AAGF23_21620 [Acidobacteriota bacterium]